MADIHLDEAAVRETVDDLKQSKTIIDLQCNTLREVMQIVESAWQCDETARFCSCLQQTQKRMRQTGNTLQGVANTLQSTLDRAKLADRLGALGFGGGGGFRS